MLGVPVDVRLAAVAWATVGYVLLWIGAVTLIVSAGRSSAFNLVATSSLWLWWVVLGPALLNVGAATMFPMPEGLELTVRQRQGYHAGWDAPLTETMQRFYRRYPEFAGYAVPPDNYSHAWYYAMQHRGDDAAHAAATSYLEALRARQAWTAHWDVLLPPVLLQRLLNGVAGTDLDGRLGYLASVAHYHEELKRFFFPRIFAGATVRDVDWSRAPAHRFISESHVSIEALVVLLVQAACLPLLGLWLAGRRSATTVLS
jgi:ABC-2 type transport system permease protein